MKQPVYEKEKLIETLKNIIRTAEEKGIKIIFTQHENKSFLTKGSDGWEIVQSLWPSGEEPLVIEKKHPSAFKETSLKSMLKQAGITRLYIAGLISNGCIMQACLDAKAENYDVVLISDAHSTFNKNPERAIKKTNDEMVSMGISVKPSTELWPLTTS